MGEQFYLKCWFLSDIFNLNLKGVIYAILYEFNRAVHFNVKAEPWAALHAKTFFSYVIGSSGLIRSSLPSFGGFFSVPGSGGGMANSYPKEPHAQSAQYDADPGSLLHGNRGARHALLSERSAEHTYELQSLMRTSYADFCLKQKMHKKHN